jgi:hypothetical protein
VEVSGVPPEADQVSGSTAIEAETLLFKENIGYGKREEKAVK